MNKKAYMCPGTQVADIDVKASLLERSPSLKYDNTDVDAMDTEADVDAAAVSAVPGVIRVRVLSK